MRRIAKHETNLRYNIILREKSKEKLEHINESVQVLALVTIIKLSVNFLEKHIGGKYHSIA